MPKQEWTPLWEDEEARRATYFAASPEERAEMCLAYEEYIQKTYPVGHIAIENSIEG